MRYFWRAKACALAATSWLITAAQLPASESWWPQFRGPAATGVARNSDFPVHFGPDSNVVWKTALPPGHSSPCIWANRIFLTGFADNKLLTICLDRRDGKILWRKEIVPDKVDRGAALGSPATATAATDGRNVFVYFGSFGLAAYDFTGNETWRKPLPIPITQHGAGTSPILAGDLLLLNCDQDVGSFLLAVRKQTGEQAWKADRAAFRRGFSTPLAFPPDKPDIAVVAGTLRLVAYSLTDGSERWSVSGLPNEMVSSPVPADGLIYVAGWTHGSGISRMPKFDELLAQFDANKDDKLARAEASSGPARQHFFYIDADKDNAITRAEWDSMAVIFERAQNAAFAVKPDGHGDVTDTHVVWKQTRGLPYVPSPLVYEGRVYLVKNGGMATCFEAKTGKVLYQEERLGAMGDYYASPVAAAGKICMISQQGLVTVLKAGDVLEILARNNLGEFVFATPALLDNRIFVRTKTQLWAFGQ